MVWYDTKSAAVDPDNPTADEQFPYSEHNAMVAYLKDTIIGKAVDAAAIGDEKIIAYDLANDKFVFVAQSAVTTLNALTDVVISGVPADNEVLAYNTATSKFINQTAAEAGLALVANVVLESDFNATTFLYATADNTPLPKTIAETLAILSVESGADVTDATNVAAAGAVMASEFDATTFLYATADNTPLPKTPAETLAILSGSAAAEFLFNTQNIGGIVDPTTAQQAATKNYADIHLFTKEIVTTFTDGFIPVYRTSSGKFEMEAGGGSAGLPVADTTSIVKGSTDGTKLMRIEVDGLTTGITRVATMPDKDITLCDDEDFLRVDGTKPMTANIDMGGHDINNTPLLRAAGTNGTLSLTVSDSPSGAMIVYGRDHASYPGQVRVETPVVSGMVRQCAGYFEGMDNEPKLVLNYGLDMNDKVIADMKNAAASALSGTQKDIEIDIGGTPYYFTVYPTKA